MNSIYDYTVKDAQGKDINLGEYKGKVLLVINSATGCGFTPQYEGLEELYEKYQQQGFEILDFPCNQFGHQAPGTNAQITSFCQSHYDVSFKQFSKIEVNGENESPVFTYLKSQRGGKFGRNIKWNFTKFLLDKDGRVVDRFAPVKTPAAIEAEIEKLL